MYDKLIKEIEKYNSIVIARHVGGDIDALGGQLGLKEVIKNTYKDKKVYAVGAYSSRFKFLGAMDNNEMDKAHSLLIVLDTPKVSRLDIDSIIEFPSKIKIDHHPKEEVFCDIEIINDKSSSVCEMIIEMCNNTKLEMNKEAAELLYMGVVADTNRFLYPSSSAKTMSICSKLIDDYKLDTPVLYEKMYLRSLEEIRFIGYIFQNIEVTKNGVGYIKITDKVQKEFGMDAAAAGNMIGELSYIDKFLVWVTFSEDTKQNFVRVSVRSRGPVVNTLCQEYNGGGHKLASGIRIPNFDLSDEIIDRLDNLCKEYINSI